MAKFKDFDAYIENAEPFAQPILNYFRECVKEACPEAKESFKWSMPFFVYQGTNLCHMAAFKKHTSFSFWLAGKMKDPQKVFVTSANSGMGQFGKVTELEQLPRRDVLIAYISEAMELIEAGEKLESSPKKAARHFEAPKEMLEALSQNKVAMANYEAFSQSNKNDYIEWIAGAKTDATRSKRLAQMMEWLEEGKPRNWKYMKEYR
ncbi:MAG: YdeI family protein [Fluviicola sp.]